MTATTRRRYFLASLLAAAATVGAALVVQYGSPAAYAWMNHAHPLASLGIVFAACVPFAYLFGRAILAK
jgi:hypothetical protein